MTARTNNGENKQRREQTTARTNKRQEQTAARTNSGKNKQRQEQTTARTNNGKHKRDCSRDVAL
jgi:hypothetical protein